MHFAVFIPARHGGCSPAARSQNLLSAAGIFDVVFGSLATLLAALCTAWLGRGRGAQSWLRCVLAALMPVVFNFVFVGAVLTWSLTDAVFPHLNASFWLFGGQVALGEVAVLGILGLPLMRLLPRNPKFREIICSYQKE
ncbi:MAG: QueT transporter family protein [Oscillospiraceae bacterium]